MLFEALISPEADFLAYNKPDQRQFRNWVNYLGNIDFQERDGSVKFAVRVIPRSSKSEIVGEQNGALKVKLKSPPVDGAANEELIRFLAKLLGVGRSSIEIVHGKSSRIKLIRIDGVGRERMMETFLK